MARTRAPVRSRRCAEPGAAHEVRVGRHHEVLEPEFEGAVVHDHVDEVHDVRWSRRRHASPPSCWGFTTRSAPARTSWAQRTRSGAGDDLELRAHRLAGDRDVEVVRIGVERSNQRAARPIPALSSTASSVTSRGRSGRDLGQPVGSRSMTTTSCPALTRKWATSDRRGPAADDHVPCIARCRVPSVAPHEVSHMSFDQQLEHGGDV